MKQNIVHIALVVKDYDDAIDFYVNKLKFDLVEDTYQPEQDKRWVVVAPPNSAGTSICWLGLQSLNNMISLAIKLVDECFFFSIRMTSGEITTG